MATVYQLCRVAQTAASRFLLCSITNSLNSVGSIYTSMRANIQSKRSVSTIQSLYVPNPCLQVSKDLAFAKAEDNNFIFSPCSFQLALSLLANGSKGSTLQELLTYLRATDLKHLNSGNKGLFESCTQDTEGPVLSVVGGVWIDQYFTLKSTFRTTVEEFYNGKVETVDFQNQVKAEEVRHKVNKWAEEATNGLVKSVLPEDSLDRMTRLVVANAYYFKGAWTLPFHKSLTEDSNFHLLDGTCVKIPFMRSSGVQSVRCFSDFKVLRLPYKCIGKKKLAMYILLPNERDGLWALYEEMVSEPGFLSRYIQPWPAARVRDFRVPKFKITCHFEASEVLKGTALELLLSDNADFSGMVHSLQPGDGLAVSKVYQKLHVEIDEKGAEAAAATVVTNRAYAGPCKPVYGPVVDFVADHPFIYVVRESRSEAIWFMGHVLNPLLHWE